MSYANNLLETVYAVFCWHLSAQNLLLGWYITLRDFVERLSDDTIDMSREAFRSYERKYISFITIINIPSYHSNTSISSDCPQCYCQPHLIYFRTQAHSAQSLSPYKWPTVHNATFNCWNLKILAFQIHRSYWIEVWYFIFGVYVRQQLNVKVVNKDRRRTERSRPSRGIRPPD